MTLPFNGQISIGEDYNNSYEPPLIINEKKIFEYGEKIQVLVNFYVQTIGLDVTVQLINDLNGIVYDYNYYFDDPSTFGSGSSYAWRSLEAYFTNHIPGNYSIKVIVVETKEDGLNLIPLSTSSEIITGIKINGIICSPECIDVCDDTNHIEYKKECSISSITNLPECITSEIITNSANCGYIEGENNMVLLGDMTNEGLITNNDAIFIGKIASGIINESNYTSYPLLQWARNWNELVSRADANQDGIVDDADRILVTNHMLFGDPLGDDPYVYSGGDIIITPCDSTFVGGSWSICNSSDIQYKTQTNECGDTQTIQQNCTYDELCTPNWKCNPEMDGTMSDGCLHTVNNNECIISVDPPIETTNSNDSIIPIAIGVIGLGALLSILKK